MPVSSRPPPTLEGNATAYGASPRQASTSLRRSQLFCINAKYPAQARFYARRGSRLCSWQRLTATSTPS